MNKDLIIIKSLSENDKNERYVDLAYDNRKGKLVVLKRFGNDKDYFFEKNLYED